VGDCPFYEPVHLPPDYPDVSPAICSASGQSQAASTGCPSGYKDTCHIYHRARAEAAEELIAHAAEELKAHCQGCKGYERTSGPDNDEPPCANCGIGFAVQALNAEGTVFPKEYR